MKARIFYLVVVSALAIGGCRQGMSKAEADEAKSEVLAMVRSAKPGDPTSIDFSVEPKTQFGKEFKAVLLKAKSVEEGLANDPAFANMGIVLSAERLSTADGRAKSIKDTEALRTLFANYYKDSAKVAQELIDVASRAAGSEPESAASLMSEVEQMAAKTDGLMDSMAKLVAYTDQTKPTLQAGALQFATDAQAQRYEALYAEFEKVAVDHDKFIADILQARASRMRSAMQTLERSE